MTGKVGEKVKGFNLQSYGNGQYGMAFLQTEEMGSQQDLLLDI